MDGGAARVVRESAVPTEDAPGPVLAGLGMARTALADRVEMGRRNRPYLEENFERELLIVELERILHAAGGRVP